MPELFDLQAIVHSASTLRRIFKWLEHSGVHIPAGRLSESWQDLLGQLTQNAFDLDIIVCKFFEQSRPPQEESVLEETLPATDSLQ
jgi:hypothetical protein